METLRTIDQTIAELKKRDPDTALTAWALRQLVKSGAIPTLMIGSKALLSVEAVERYVNAHFRSIPGVVE